MLCAIEHYFIAVFPAPSCRCQRTSRHAMVTNALGYKGRHFYMKHSEFKPKLCCLRNLYNDAFALKHGYSDVVIAFSDVRSRESRCCTPPSPPSGEIQNAACRHDHRRRQTMPATSRIRWRHYDRRSIRIETRHRQNPLLFSTFGFATTTANPECCVSSQTEMSQVFRRQLRAFTHPPRRCRHDRRSTRIETRHRQSATRATGRIRRHETASFKYPSIRCYRSSSRYQ